MKNPKPKTVNQSKLRKKLVKDLDLLVGQIVKKRDGNRCVICGTTEMPQSGHLITRAKYSVRWDLRNLNVQCAKHNMLHEWNPHLYTDWYITYFGEQAYHDLVRESNIVRKMSTKDLERLKEELKLVYETTTAPSSTNGNI